MIRALRRITTERGPFPLGERATSHVLLQQCLLRNRRTSSEKQLDSWAGAYASPHPAGSSSAAVSAVATAASEPVVVALPSDATKIAAGGAICAAVFATAAAFVSGPAGPIIAGACGVAAGIASWADAEEKCISMRTIYMSLSNVPWIRTC